MPGAPLERETLIIGFFPSHRRYYYHRKVQRFCGFGGGACTRKCDLCAPNPGCEWHQSPRVCRQPKFCLQGKEVCEALEVKPGVWMTGALSKVLDWQLEHPQKTKDDCRVWLVDEFRNGRLVAMDAKRSNGDGGGAKKRSKPNLI